MGILCNDLTDRVIGMTDRPCYCGSGHPFEMPLHNRTVALTLFFGVTRFASMVGVARRSDRQADCSLHFGGDGKIINQTLVARVVPLALGCGQTTFHLTLPQRMRKSAVNVLCMCHRLVVGQSGHLSCAKGVPEIQVALSHINGP